MIIFTYIIIGMIFSLLHGENTFSLSICDCCNFSDPQLIYALGTVIYIHLEWLMNGKAIHVMRF